MISAKVELFYNDVIEKPHLNLKTNKMSLHPIVSRWRSAEQQCIEIESFFGNKAIDVSKRNLGYDIESLTPKGVKRYIEVKLISNNNNSFSITNNEYTAAHQYGDDYFICLIKDAKGDSQAIYIQNPLRNLNFEKRIRQWEWYCDQFSGDVYYVKIK